MPDTHRPPRVRTALVAAVVTGAVATILPEAWRTALLALLLALAAGLYPGFAYRARAGPGEVALQWTVALGFTGIAFLGLVRTPWALVAGWLLHAGWDALHHDGRRGRLVPAFYPPLCVAYDVVVGIWLAALLLL